MRNGKVEPLHGHDCSDRHFIVELRTGRFLNVYKTDGLGCRVTGPNERLNFDIQSIGCDTLPRTLTEKDEISSITLPCMQMKELGEQNNSSKLFPRNQNINIGHDKTDGKTSAIKCKDSKNCSKTLFFIHGVGGSLDSWSPQLRYFESLNYIVVAMDLIGHGFSYAPDHSSEYTFSEISEDVSRLFEKYHGPENIVIGHSYGCSFVAYLAHEYTHLITRLVLISGGAPLPLAPELGVFSLPVCCIMGVRPCLNSSFTKKAIHATKRTSACDRSLDVPSYVLSHMMRGQVWPDGDESYHGNINVATLIIHGAHDQITTLDMDQFMHETIVASQLVVVDDASHMVMLEQPDKVNQLIHDFIEQLPRAVVR